MRAIKWLSVFLWLTSALAQDFAPMTINNWTYWQRGDGHLVSPNTGQDPATLPQNTIPVLYTDGLVWAGKVRAPQDGGAALRAGGHYYESGTQAGAILGSGAQMQATDPNQAHVYRIRRDWATVSDAELRNDAAITFNKKISEISSKDLDSLRSNYKQDWNNWPAEAGAPYYDRNGNGKWDAGVDEPGIASADQVIGYVYNDLDVAKSHSLFGSLPIGFEIRVSLWAYKYDNGALSRTFFERFEIWNTSGQVIDSLYFGYFTEFDAGDYADDLNGCDPALNMGYTYNGRDNDAVCATWGQTPPALACILMQGPWVDAPGASGIRNLQRSSDIKNLPMTAFWHKATGSGIWDPELGSYNGTVSMFAI